jgi:hypothetical protein
MKPLCSDRINNSNMNVLDCIKAKLARLLEGTQFVFAGIYLCPLIIVNPPHTEGMSPFMGTYPWSLRNVLAFLLEGEREGMHV